MYELRTNGPEKTARNPIASPMTRYSSNTLRRDVLDDVELLAFRLQVLADRDDLDVRFVEPLQHVDDFVAPLAEAEHEAGLGRDRRVDPFRFAQDRQRALETRAGTDEVVEPRNRLDVVIEVVGLAPRRRCAPIRSCRENRTSAPRPPHPAAPRAAPAIVERELLRAAVVEIIARDARDDDVPQPHPLRRLGHRSRLIRSTAARRGGRWSRCRSRTSACRRRRGS